jgi:peptidoglycan/xylan/chitin deacetylase (PgdA/CDA1 family)
VRVVIATGPPFIPFGAVASWTTRRSVPLILDYRDLWTANPHGDWTRAARAAVGWLFERRTNRRARVITTVSAGCATMLSAGTPEVPVRVLFNTPDQAHLAYFRTVVDDVRTRDRQAEEAGPSLLHMVFAGQVYQGCTFAPVLRALQALPPETWRQVRLHYYGASSALAQREFAQFGLGECLVDHGKVSKDESVRAICGADLLLSLIHTDRVARDPAVAGHMSTKVYDYFLSGIPILNIGPTNADVKAFAASIRYAPFHSFPAGDTTEIAGFLKNAVSGSTLHPVPPLSVSLPRFEDDLSEVLVHVERWRPPAAVLTQDWGESGPADTARGRAFIAGEENTYATQWSQATPNLPMGVTGHARSVLRSAVLSVSSAAHTSIGDSFLRCLYCHLVFDDQVARFDQLIGQLTRIGQFVDTDTCVDMLSAKKPIDGRYFHLSFDDGFRNNFTNALPILRRHKVPAMFFVPTALVGAPWQVARSYCLERTLLNGVVELLTWDDLKGMRDAGYDIGSHTQTHARFADISGNAALLQEELLGSKGDLEARLGMECRYISWPYGRLSDADAVSLKMTQRAGYSACFGAFRGTVVPGVTDPFSIPRHYFEVHWPLSHVRYFARGNMEAGS